MTFNPPGDPFVWAGVALYAVAFWNCYKVIVGRHTPGGSIAWILVHIGLPVVGVPLYFLLGDNRLHGYSKRHKQRARQVQREGGAKSSEAEVSERFHEPLGRLFESTARFLHDLGPVFDPVPGSAQLLIDGQNTFEAIFEAIEGAKHYILIQYYILRSDRLGLELKRLLITKAAAGVPVYLLYDDMGSFWLSRSYIRDLKKAGVHVERFLPVLGYKRFFQANFRNHRKLVSVDGRCAFTGGLNVGEEYATRRYKSRRVQTQNWRDTHVRVTGPGVGNLEEVFLEDWNFATGEVLDLQRLQPPQAGRAEPLAAGTPPQMLQTIPTGPADENVVSVLFLLHIFTAAQNRLWITTPYFIPDPTLLRALELALFRGVEVRLLLPRRADHVALSWVSASYVEGLLEKGAQVLLYEDGMMHQKVLLVDDRFAAVGTMNVDNRALYLNFETTVAVHGRRFNEQVAAMLERDFATSRPYTKEKRPTLRHLKKIRAHLLRLLAPLL